MTPSRVDELRRRVRILETDLTCLHVDAVVNPANETLLGGGGVDGALHRAAGPGLVDECRTLGGCRVGEAKVTSAHRLAARFVIHTVGPVWMGGHRSEREALARCYRQCLARAAECEAGSVAFPGISTGAYRYPLGDASRIAAREVWNWLAHHDLPVGVVMCTFDADATDAMDQAFDELVAECS